MVISDPNAVVTVPESKTTVLRVAGADTSAPMLVAPTWQNNSSATTSHDAPGITVPSGGGLVVNTWHTYITGA